MLKCTLAGRAKNELSIGIHIQFPQTCQSQHFLHGCSPCSYRTTHIHTPSTHIDTCSFLAIYKQPALIASWENGYSLILNCTGTSPKSHFLDLSQKLWDTKSLHRSLHSSVSPCKLASGLSQLQLVSVECAYQSCSRGMRPNSLVPWWLRRLVQACDMSSSGWYGISIFLSSGNFHHTQNSPTQAPTLSDPFFFLFQSRFHFWSVY